MTKVDPNNVSEDGVERSNGNHFIRCWLVSLMAISIEYEKEGQKALEVSFDS